MVVPAPELSSIDVAVASHVGMTGSPRKGRFSADSESSAYWGISLITGPLTAGAAAAGAFGGSIC